MSKNYEISIPHFYCLEYKENNRKMFLEIDFREPFIDLTMSLIQHWEPPFENEEITEKDKKHILQNIYNYFIFDRKWGDCTNISITFDD